MANFDSQENLIYMVPKTDGLTKKILDNTATVQDFVMFDEKISQYLSTLGIAYLETERKEIKRFYCFLSIVIQQFQEFLTFVAHVNFDYTYEKNVSYRLYKNNNLKEIFFFNDTILIFPAKFGVFKDEKLPICDVKLAYVWLSTIIDMEETFSPNVSLFSDYHSYMISALEELTKNNYYI